MKQVLIYIIVAAVSLVLGYFVDRFLIQQYEIKIKVSPPLSSTIEGQTEFGCDSVASAFVAKMGNENSVRIFAGRGTDKLALRFNASGKSVSLLTQAAVGIGESEGTQHQIIKEDDEHIVALAQVSAVMGPGYSLLLFNKKEHRGVWTKTSGALWTSGEIMYLTCY